MRWVLAALLVVCTGPLLSACAGPGATEVAPGRDAVTTVRLGPEDALAGAEADEAATALAEALTAGVRAVLPDGLAPEETALFRRYDDAGAVASASPLADLDLSGVAWGPGPIVTMITDRHAIVSAHVPKDVGAPVRLVTRDGWPVARTVAAKTVLAPVDGTNLDIAVVRLDAPVPADVRTYPLAVIDAGVFARLRGKGAPVVATFAGRQATVSTLRGATDDGLRLMLSIGAPTLGLPEAAGHAAQWGDSGHPIFWVAGGELVLASHYHTSAGAGAGPNYADARVRAAVEAAVAELGD